MKNRILTIKEERANVYDGMKKILDIKEDLTQEKRDELAKLETRFDTLTKDAESLERQLERERKLGETGAKPEERRDVPDKEKEARNAFGKYLRNGTQSEMSEYRALAQDNPTQAGYLVAPTKFMAEVIQDKNNITFMRQLSKVLPALEKAQSLGFPKRTTAMNTFAWGSEISAPTPDSALAFGKREFIAKVATGGILVSKTLIRNSSIDIDAYVRQEMATNQAVNEEQAFMTGDGVGKPLGIFTASADGISTARDVSDGNTAAAVTFDGLKNVVYNFEEQYRNGLSWIFHRDIVKMIAKIKDGDGQYIWQQSVAVGESDSLLGYKINMSEYAPNTIGASNYVGMLGNYKEGYWITDSLNFEIQALLELYALTNQVYFIGRHEVDAMPVLEKAFTRVKLGT